MPSPSDLPAEPHGPWRFVRGLLLSIVALLGLLTASASETSGCVTSGCETSGCVTSGCENVDTTGRAVVSSTDAATDVADPLADPARLGSSTPVEEGPSAVEFEEPQEELHALAAAAWRRLMPLSVSGATARAAPRPVMADWHLVAPGRAPPA